MEIKILGRDRAVCFEVGPGERILHAGLRQGFALPYECASGTCGTCRATLVRGEVDDLWPDAPGRKHVKADAGELLMCQHSARSDCTLQLPGKLADAEPDAPLPRAHRAVVSATEWLTHDVMRFSVSLHDSCRFRAGQFMLIGLPGLQGARAYSMVNYDEPAHTLEFVIKNKPGGGFCERAFCAPFRDMCVTVFGPLGAASFEPALDRNLLCIAGGTGVAGMMAMLSHAAASGHLQHRRADLFFGVRTANDLFFMRELTALAERFPSALSVTLVLSDEPVSDHLRSSHPLLRFDQGFVHEATARTMVGRYEGTRAYVAGPPVAVDAALRMLLLEARLPATEIRYDKFG